MTIVRALKIGDTDIAGAPPVEAFAIPVQTGLLGAFFLGEGVDTGIRNWAGDDIAVVSGSPTWADGYCSFSGGGRIITNVAETLAMTLVLVARRTDDAVATGFLGNYSGTAPANGVSLRAVAGNNYLQGSSARVGSPSGTTAQNPALIDSWTAAVFTTPESGASTNTDAVSGASGLSASEADRIINGLGNMQIGAVGSLIGDCDVAMVLMYNRALSAGEVSDIGAFAIGYAERRGLL